MAQPRLSLAGQSARLLGAPNALTEALLPHLSASGATFGASDVPDLVILALPLDPTQGFDWSDLRAEVSAIGRAMKQRGTGRIVFLMSAIGAVPVRRYPAYSAEMAAAYAVMRGLAMELAPEVTVNALGAGAILSGAPQDAYISGDAVMEGHTGLKRAGTLDELVGGALLLCDPLNSYLTGQLLCVDGGWSVGYARSF